MVIDFRFSHVKISGSVLDVVAYQEEDGFKLAETTTARIRQANLVDKMLLAALNAGAASR